jgi:hypothetical protein
MKIFISQDVQGRWQPVTIIGIPMSAFLLRFFKYKYAKPTSVTTVLFTLVPLPHPHPLPGPPLSSRQHTVHLPNAT